MEFSHKFAAGPGEGPESAPVLFLSGCPAWDGKPFSEHCKNLLTDLAQTAGLRPTELRFEAVLGELPPGRKELALGTDRTEHWKAVTRERLETSPANVIVPCGNLALETLTGHKSVDKWQLSIIPASALRSKKKVVPLLHPERVFAKYADIPFLLFGMQRIREEMTSPVIKRRPQIMHIAPTFEQAYSFLINKCLLADALSVDIETAWGQITCVGFGPSASEAMCVPLLTENWPLDQLHKLWGAVADVLAGPSRKIFQNFIYDCSYLSKYGMTVKNLWHDTMLAQKFLYPELPMGLDTIARIYTREPYWKDEGKDWKQTSGDLKQFWTYNCKDVLVTFEAAVAQRALLETRSLTDVFERRVMTLTRPATEMCWRGLPVSLERRTELRQNLDTEVEGLERELSEITTPVLGRPLSSRSPKQVKTYLKAKGYRLPTKKGKETSDVTALMKLLQRYPSEKALPLLISLSEKNKAVSSYLKPTPYPDGRHRFRLTCGGTDTGRWSSGLDSWDNGFNAQTMPSWLKKMFVAPPGWLFLEVDLEQADARYVAWDAPEPTLIKFFQEGKDIHRFVASRPELFNKSESEVTSDERQLGKKVGHASNYGMRGGRLSEICLLEMDLVIAPTRADQMLEGYHRVFPGIRQRQGRIQSELKRTKKLTTPLGKERHFYDRLGDELYRSAYAYAPQSVVCDVINSLITHSDTHRNPERLHHILQVHDSYIMLVQESYLPEALALCGQTELWNPKLSLPGGLLQIPAAAKAGTCLGELSKVSL